MRTNLLFIFTLVYCANYPPVIEKQINILEHLAMQDQIKKWIRSECGSCHTSTLPSSKPKALQVFDLKYSDWMSRMNKRQLEFSFVKKLGRTVKEEDREIVTQALGAELFRRRRSKPM